MSTALACALVMFWASVPFVPAEPVLVAAGSWSAAGGPPVAMVVAAAAAGSLASDLAKYAIGRYAGAALLIRLRRVPAAARATAWIEARMLRAGPVLIVPSYFVPFGVVVATLLSGALRLPPGRVVAASAAGAVLWATVFTTLGYAGAAITGDPLVGIAIGLCAMLAITLLVARRTEAAAAPVTDRGSP